MKLQIKQMNEVVNNQIDEIFLHYEKNLDVIIPFGNITRPINACIRNDIRVPVSKQLNQGNKC